MLTRSSNEDLSVDYTSKGKVSASLREQHTQVIDYKDAQCLALIALFASQNRATFVILSLLPLMFWRLENNLDGSIDD